MKVLLLILFPLFSFAQITTNWGEDYPYNQFCPHYNNQPTYAGNRSVAMAQILNYYNHPNTGTSEITYDNIWTGTVSCEFYQEYQPAVTDQQKAWLVFAAGASCQHPFSPFLQNSLCDIINLDTIRKAFNEYWGYLLGEITTNEELIIEDILNGHPVLLESYPLPPQLGCARYFILDDYENGYFHVNTSFGGLDNGWYPLNNIEFMNTHFGADTKALIGIIPDSITVSGYVYYDGTTNPLMGTLWVDGHSYPIDSCGHFQFSISKDMNFVTIDITSSWAYVNAMDALTILRVFTGLTTLTGLRGKACDVSADHAVNALDALLCAKRFVGQIQGFQTGDWVSDDLIINSDTTIVINARCYGDVIN